VLDHGAGDLASLAALTHVGAVITAAEDERTERLLRHLRGELHRRRRRGRAAGGGARLHSIVVLIDGWSGFATTDGDLDAIARRDEIARLVADGPALGIWTVITADTATAVPLTLANLIPAKLVFRLADRHDHATFGLTTSSPPALPGRALDTRTGLEVQLALAGDVAPRSGRAAAPAIETLPEEVRLADLPAGAVGIGDDDLTPRTLPLRAGDGALVTGPARSGRSTALCTIASACSAVGWQVTALAPRPSSPLRTCGSVRLVTSVGDLVEATRSPGRHLLLVDDAETVDDPLGELAAVIAAQPADVHLVASARSDALRAAYGHWARDLRRSRLGLALRPDPDDGDLLGTTFPRRARPAANAGRGYLVVDGVVEVVQVAR
jgi:S-DNA-T family DNA segregation ATPase FtsK/SpoIIIE